MQNFYAKIGEILCKNSGKREKKTTEFTLLFSEV